MGSLLFFLATVTYDLLTQDLYLQISVKMLCDSVYSEIIHTITYMSNPLSPYFLRKDLRKTGWAIAQICSVFCMQHRVLGIILEVGTGGRKKVEGEGIDEMTRNT